MRKEGFINLTVFKGVILLAGIISHLSLCEKNLSNFVFWLKNAKDFPKIQQNPVVSTIDKFLGGSYNCFDLSKSVNVKMSINAHIERIFDKQMLFLRKNEQN